MILETVPLYLLFELSVLVASVTERRAERAAAAAAGAAAA
jgi:Sec-independent protein secretion pathway component TatC